MPQTQTSIEPGAPAAAEAERLAAVRALELLDTAPEAIFDSLTKLAALTFNTPVALITLIDAERQWFKACVGTDVRETPREIAFCDHTIRQRRALVVPDALEDPRFRQNPLVTGEPHIRFYAGAPLTSADGHRLGSLCVLDLVPRPDFGEAEQARLEAMAEAVSVAMIQRRDIQAYMELERRLRAADDELRAEQARLQFLTDNSADLILRLDRRATITWASPSCRRYGYEAADLVGATVGGLVHPDDLSGVIARQAAWIAGQDAPKNALGGPNGEYRIRCRDGQWTWVEENPSIIRDARGQAVEIVNILRDITDRKRVEQAAAEIQAGMLPPRQALAALSPRVEVDAVLQPARNVGGDLFDAFMLDRRRLCFLIGDVTGKGMPAALFMALAKTLSHSVLLHAADDLAAGVRALSAELSRNNGEGMGLSLLVGQLDLESGALQLCNAGCDDPFLVAADGSVSDLPMEGGPPLCAEADYPYAAETYRLAPGATLVAVTDGVTEACDLHGRPFGRERTKGALAGPAGRSRLTDLMDGVVGAVRAFEGGGLPGDDVAAIAVRRV